MRKKMKDRNLLSTQSQKFESMLFEKIESLVKHAAETGVVSDVMTGPEIENIIPIREVDEIDLLAEVKLKKRLTAGSEHKRAIGEILKAIKEGQFLINVIAPGYSEHKDLVDLIVSSALQGYYQTYQNPVAREENLSPEEKNKREKIRRLDRSNKVDNSIVADIDVLDILKKVEEERKKVRSQPGAQPPSIEEIAGETIEESFFGSKSFDPKDRTNCCYEYVRDYISNPFPTEADEDSPNDRDVARDNGNREVAKYSLFGLKQKPFNFAIPEQERAHRMILKHPSREDSQIRVTPGAFPGLYFDERGNMPLRFDPSNQKSYMFPFQSEEILQRENDGIDSAKSLYFRMMDNGMEANEGLRTKWMLFTKLLSAIQGTRPISVFHASGFDEEGNFRGLPPTTKGGNPVPVELPEIPEETITLIIRDFLKTIGMTNEEVAGQISDALRKETNPSPVPPAFKRLNQRDVNALGRDDKIRYLAEEFLDDVKLGKTSLGNLSASAVRAWLTSRENMLPNTLTLAPQVYNILKARSANSKSKFVKTSNIRLDGDSSEDNVNKIAYTAGIELPVSSIEDSFVLREWIFNRFGAENSIVWPKVRNKLKYVSNNFKEVRNGFIKEAAISPIIRNSRFFENLRSILDRSAKIDKSRISNITAEYIIDLLIKYLQRKIEESDVVDYAEDSQKGIVGENEFGISQTIQIPFGQREQEKLGIQSQQDFDNVLRPNTNITIISEDGRSESFRLSRAIIKSDDGSVMDYSPNGPLCELRLNNSPTRNFEKGKYSVIIGGNLSVSGLKKAMYEWLYGIGWTDEKRTKRFSDVAEELHSKNGVSLNLSIYPSWVPSPFDYREISEEGHGHPNNAYNLNKALQQRLKLRSRYEKRKVYDSRNRECIKNAMELLDQEIGEMRLVLFKDSPTRYNMDVEEIQNGKDPYGSMMEGKGQADVEKNYDFFYEVSRRCREKGIDIGKFSPSFDSDIIADLLPPQQQERFLQIRQRVLNEWQNSKRFFVLRNVTKGVASGTNGFMSSWTGQSPKITSPTSKGESEGEGEEKGSTEVTNIWNEKFAGYVENLYSKFRGEASIIDPRKAKNHMIIISEEAVPKLVVEPYYVQLQISYIDKEEVEALFKHYESVEIGNYIKDNQLIVEIENPELNEKQRNIIKSFIERIQSFSIPISFIRRVQDQLSGLSFSEIDTFIMEVVSKFFESYSSSKTLSIIEILDLESREWNDRMEELKREDPRLRRLNIRSEKPNVTYDSYVTEFGSEWQSHVSGEIKTRIDAIQRNNNLLNFYRRMLDTKIFFGTLKTTKDKDKTIVSFQYPIGETNNVWFDGSIKSVEIVPTEVGREMRIYADKAKYSMIEEDAYAYLGRNKITNAIKDVNSLVEYENKLRDNIEKIEADTKKQKNDYPVSIVLEGDPGTGKSIFGEVLASALDCKFYSTTFDSIVYAGQSSFRGVSEQNITNFLDCLRSLWDSVLLIDEMDKFLNTTGLSGSDSDVIKALGKLQKSWEDSKDFAIYKEHNLHLIFTTNFWQKIAETPSTQAFASRIGPSGRQFNVPLPASYETLLNFFQGEAVSNNLLNSQCGGDAAITYYAKQVIENYDSTDPKQQELVKKYIKTLLKKNKNFFTVSTLLLPKSAEMRFAKKNGLNSKTCSQVEDFVNGWRMIKTLITETNKDQVVTVDGKKKTIKPLELICRQLEEKMRYTADRLNLSKDYPRTSMREMMNVMRGMFMSHQKFMSGEEDLPFNWKTFYISVCQTVFKGAIDEDEMVTEDRNNPMFARERSQARVNGWRILKDWVYSEDLSPTKTSDGTDKRIPMQSLLTEKQFRDLSKQRKEQIQEYPIEKNGDGGASHFMEQLSVAFYFNSSIFEDNLKNTVKLLNGWIKEKSKEERSGTGISEDDISVKLLEFLDVYSINRKEIFNSFLTFNSSKDQVQRQKIFDRVRYVCDKRICVMIDSAKRMDVDINVLLTNLPPVCLETYKKIKDGRESLSRYLNSLDCYEISQMPMDEVYKNWDSYRQKASRLLAAPGNEGISNWSSVIIEQGIKGGEMSQEAFNAIYGREVAKEKIDFKAFSLQEKMESPEIDIESEKYKAQKKLEREPEESVISPASEQTQTPSETLITQPPVAGESPIPQPLVTPPTTAPVVPSTQRTPEKIVGPAKDLEKDIQNLDLFPEKKDKKKKKEENGKAATTTDYYYKVAEKVLISQTVPPTGSVSAAPVAPTATSTPTAAIPVIPNATPQLQQEISIADDGFVISNDKLFENVAKAIKRMTQLRHGEKGVPMLEDDDDFSQLISIRKKKK